MTTVKAIPTEYNGTCFRSRLEARWAAMFDLLGWRWEYEPLDLRKYIPDFIVGDRLIEVKPVMKFADYTPAQKTIERSGWRGPASVVGATVGEVGCGMVCLGVEWLDWSTDNSYWAPWLSDLEVDKAIHLWREAGNRAQWLGRDSEPRRKVAPHRRRSVPEAYKPFKPEPPRETVPLDEVRSFFATLDWED